MNNTITSPFFIQAKPLFRYEKNAGHAQQGKKMDTTVTITSTGVIGVSLLMKGKDGRSVSRFA
ncbi:MAG TPA: hypothetical protein VJ720_08935 [Chitinophaga sp.]|nr:hypothetical protein [Chitinophaga sp.]